jgi:hypothetical protein
MAPLSSRLLLLSLESSASSCSPDHNATAFSGTGSGDSHGLCSVASCGLVRREEIAAVAAAPHVLSLPVELLLYGILAFLCDDDFDRTLALRVVCKELRPLAEQHAVQWMRDVLPTRLSAQYST